MKVIAKWSVDSTQIELLHETGLSDPHARWEFRVDGDVKMYGEGTPKAARQAVFTRRKLNF